MPEVRIGSEIKTYPQGTAYAEIAEEYQKNYENDILLGLGKWTAAGAA